MGKLKRVKRPSKKSTKTPKRGVVIRETPEMPLTKKREKVDVTRGKGIELLSQLALTEDAQFEEVRKKSMRDFYKTRPSGSSTITKTTLSVAKIKPSSTNDSNNKQVLSDEDSDQENDNGDDKTQSDNELESDSEHETDESELGIESNHDESEENKEYDDDEDETNITDNSKGVKVEEIDYTTSQLYDDVGSEIVSPLDVHVYHEVPSQQTPTLLTVRVSVIFDSSPVFSTVILQSLPFFTPLPHQSSPTPPPTTEAINPQSTLPNFASVFHFNNRVTVLEKEVAELKKDDPLTTQVIALVDEHLDARLGATKDEFINFFSASITARITKQVKNQLPRILPKEVSDFAPLVIQSIVTESLEQTFFCTYGKAYSLKRSQKDKDKDEDPSAGSNQGLKNKNTSKDAEPEKGRKVKESQSSLSKGDKSKSKSSGKYVQSKEPEFEVAESDMPHDQ
uniref:Uncharacterized protein n=1 Tax=Tanacetum cinerariifolium TaxID=118510 RepID=A0A6L2MR46_TANCI|nr:hypothetical protein [Tanacetum cinerariifolium]